MAKFTKGQSGNPGGRPKDVARIGEIAREHSEEAINKLAQLMNHNDPHVAIKASCALLDRALGKPKQATELSGPDGGPIVEEQNVMAEILADILSLEQMEKLENRINAVRLQNK